MTEHHGWRLLAASLVRRYGSKISGPPADLKHVRFDMQRSTSGLIADFVLGHRSHRLGSSHEVDSQRVTGNDS